MKVRFAGKIYDVVDTRTIPGGVMQYAVEDEPNHIDWLTDVEIIDSRMILRGELDLKTLKTKEEMEGSR